MDQVLDGAGLVEELFIGGKEVIEGELILTEAELTGALVIVFELGGDIIQVPSYSNRRSAWHSAHS